MLLHWEAESNAEGKRLVSRYVELLASLANNDCNTRSDPAEETIGIVILEALIDRP